MTDDQENDNNELFNYAFINGKRVRGAIENWKELWIYKHCKTKPDYWWQLKISLRKHPTGYKNYKVSINNKAYAVARVNYKLYNPNWDIVDSSKINEIIHMNNDSMDDNIDNLRNLTQQQNMWIRDGKGFYQLKSGKWMGRISLNGEQTTKQFDTKEEANDWYLNMKEELHSVPE
jgi:hypothetical protein